jgi:hypothetical protein
MVMAWLVPDIPILTMKGLQDWDARDQRGHDEPEVSAVVLS